MAAEAEEKDGTTAGESGALKRRAATSPQRLAAAKGGAAQVKQWMWRKGQTDGSTPKEAARGGAPSPDRLQDDAATVVAILPEAEAVAAESRGGAAAARSWIDAWKRQQSGYGSRPQGSSAAAPTVKQAESAAATPTSSKSNMPENLKSSWGETHAEAAKAGSKGMKDDFEAIEKGLASSAETFNAAGSSLVESISSEAGSPRYSASDAEARASEARAWISFWRRKQARSLAARLL